MKLQDMLPLLRCPRGNGPLTLAGEKLVTRSGQEYPIISGKPVLVRTIMDWHVTPPREGKISQNIALYRPPESITAADAKILHLGSGNVPSPDPRVISLDVLPCANVDLVAEAEALPFQDHALDYVESGAVFEHLHDPWKAVSEIKRVLKPGGQFRIDTAFMQGYHGFPGHYYNMTPQAVETGLAGDFTVRQSFVPDSATPLMTIVMIIERYLEYVSKDLRKRLEQMPLHKVLETMRQDLSLQSPLLADYDEYALRCLAASFVVQAEKPRDYEARVSEIEKDGQVAVDDWKSQIREYYTARVELMQRHHEICLYRRWSREKGNNDPTIPEPPELQALLDDLKPADMLDRRALETCLARFRQTEATLRAIRDRWISLFLLPAPKIWLKRWLQTPASKSA